MKFAILGLFAFAAVAQSSVIPIQPAAVTLVRTPNFDSAIVQSQRHNDQFSYSTYENHAYQPVVQAYNSYPWSYNVVPQVYYTPQHYYPTYTVVQQNPQYVPAQGIYPSVQIPTFPATGQQPGTGVVEVEDPADNAAQIEQVENFQQENINNFNNNNNADDDDTVSVESA